MLRKLLLLLIISLFFVGFEVQAGSSTGFDFPVGAPDGAGYCGVGCSGLSFLEKYDYEGDGLSEFHPGEDWNGRSNDRGSNIYSVAKGTVVYARYAGKSWGYLIMIEHLVGGQIVWSQYGHLDSIAPKLLNKSQVKVERNEVIGAMGDFPDGSGKNSHLHFEIRKKYRTANSFVMDWPKSKVEEYYHNPSEFIKTYRPVKTHEINVSEGDDKSALISWEASNDPRLSSFELYRSNVSGGTVDPEKRTKVFETSDRAATRYFDFDAKNPGRYYYALYANYKSGQVGISEEKNYEIKNEVVQITTNKDWQQYPQIHGNRIFWFDIRRAPDGRETWQLFYYDLEENQEKVLQVGTLMNGVKTAQIPRGSKNYVVFFATDIHKTSTNVYCYDFLEETLVPITVAEGPQQSPDVSDEGIVVWMDARNDGGDIYYLDLRNADGEKVLVAEKYTQKYPRIWGNKVIWKDTRAGNRTDLYIKEIGGTEELLATNTGASAASLWENWVAWDKSGKVSLINTETKEVTEITNEHGSNPRVRDGKVVYHKYYPTEKVGRIHVYDIKTKTEKVIDFKLDFLSFPDISGDIVVFDHGYYPDQWSNLNVDIYMTRV